MNISETPSTTPNPGGCVCGEWAYDLLRSEGDLTALAAMKKCTDFNDLNRWGARIEAMKRQMGGCEVYKISGEVAPP